MSRRILIVEDEPASLEFLSSFLRKEGYEISEARDGAEAIELIDKSRFDLVLSDVRMPHVERCGSCAAYTFHDTDHSCHHDDGYSFRACGKAGIRCPVPEQAGFA